MLVISEDKCIREFRQIPGKQLPQNGAASDVPAAVPVRRQSVRSDLLFGREDVRKAGCGAVSIQVRIPDVNLALLQFKERAAVR
jgi:hypothetical protein